MTNNPPGWQQQPPASSVPPPPYQQPPPPPPYQQPPPSPHGQEHQPYRAQPPQHQQPYGQQLYGQQPSQAAYGWAPHPTTPPRRKRRTPLIVGVALGALLLAGGGLAAGYSVWLANAQEAYDDAVADLKNAAREVTQANTLVQSTVEDAESQQTFASDVSALESELAGLVDPGMLTDFTDVATVLDSEILEVLDPMPVPRVPSTAPSTPWELTEAVDEITAQTKTVLQDLKTYASSTDGIDDALLALKTSAQDVFWSAEEYSQAMLNANISAKNLDKIDFLDAAEQVVWLVELDDSSAETLTTYITAATTLEGSQQIEMAEKTGPLLETRLIIEQYARDYAGDVMLDFDWAPLVNGYGDGDSVGGTAKWWMDPGRATIQLSDSVARLWGGKYDAMAKALVVHEVGHAVTVRCGDMYDWSTQASIEEWATAWAIVQGHTADGNGVSIYGQPSAAMLTAARGCK